MSDIRTWRQRDGTDGRGGEEKTVDGWMGLDGFVLRILLIYVHRRPDGPPCRVLNVIP